MIKWYSVQSKVSAFAYYPLLEIGVGIFLLLCSLAVPILFVVYNGIKLEQWGELLFCLGFLLLFFYMGKSLIFQSLKVSVENDKFNFYQNLRDPAVQFELDRQDFRGLATRDIQVGEETFILLLIKTSEHEKEFYRSVNRKEIQQICDALIKLGKSSQEE
jgi:hypothetical protein